MDNYKNPGVAAVLSFIFIGLGQVYNGDIKKGLLLMLISAISMAVFIAGAVIIACYFINVAASKFSAFILGGVLITAGILVILITGTYNIYDAYNRAKQG